MSKFESKIKNLILDLLSLKHYWIYTWRHDVGKRIDESNIQGEMYIFGSCQCLECTLNSLDGVRTEKGKGLRTDPWEHMNVEEKRKS